MSDENLDFEVYVKDGDVAEIVSVLKGEIADIFLDSIVEGNMHIYKDQNVTLIIKTGIDDGYTSVWLRGEARWPSSVEMGRFLSQVLAATVRCEPDGNYPNVDPYSDVMVEIKDGFENLVNWID